MGIGSEGMGVGVERIQIVKRSKRKERERKKLIKNDGQMEPWLWWLVWLMWLACG
jgi:hypothetical protein